jgi:hypothetical protein
LDISPEEEEDDLAGDIKDLAETETMTTDEVDEDED